MLELLGITKRFNPGTVNEKLAIDGLDLQLVSGDFVTVVGSNGAGKSTLFNAISGVFYPDEGSILLDGKDITFLPEHKRSRTIGRLFQDPLRGTAPNMSIEENLSLAALSATRRGSGLKWVSRKDKEGLREHLSLLGMGLEDRMKQPVGLLSGGQRQALTLLMATIITPKLLLLDEHTAALDPAAAETILHLTQQLVQERQITCMMVTHNMKNALDMGNRTLMMDNGKIVLDIGGQERKNLQVSDLLARFHQKAGKALDDDRMLLSDTD